MLAPPASVALPTLSSKEIVLRGSSSGYVDFTLPRKVEVAVNDIKVTSKAPYAGFVITRTTPAQNVEMELAVLSVAEFEKKAPGLGPQWFGWDELDAGRYRMHLLGKGQTEIHIPVTGLRSSIKLRARGNTVVEGGVESLGSLPETVERRVSIERKKYGLTLFGMLAIVDNHQGSYHEHCLLIDEETRCAPVTHARIGDTQGVVVSPGASGEGWWYSMGGIFPRWVAPRRYGAFQRAASASTGREYLSIVLDIDLTGPRNRVKLKPTPPRTVSAPYQFSGVDGTPTCGAFVQDVWIASCDGFVSRSTERFVKIDLVDKAGGPVAGRVFTEGKTIEFCGSTPKRLRITPEEFVGVSVIAHPTSFCPTGHGTTGEMKFTFTSK